MAFSNIELYQSRDRLKQELSKQFDINLVDIPFWWDISPYSLINAMEISLKNDLNSQENKKLN